ncbi:MAG: hypothetical protein CSA81_10935 [Acidobacteria bacterium]|nr:MAG: hypothetical protein CSA81_10935 [Acidobacteriota bacterium]
MNNITVHQQIGFQPGNHENRPAISDMENTVLLCFASISKNIFPFFEHRTKKYHIIFNCRIESIT